MCKINGMHSDIIESFKKDVKNNKNAEKIFWEKIEASGTPIIEEIQGDENNCLITYVYKGSEETENVLVTNPTSSQNYKENYLEKISGTNVWYKSYVVRNDIRGKYYFSVNDTFEEDFQKRYHNLIHDVYSENKIIDREKIMSYFKMPKAKEHFWIKEREDVLKGNTMEYKIESKVLKENRNIAIYTPHGYRTDHEAYRYLVLNDGDGYIEVMSAIQVLDNLIADKKIPPIVVIFVNSTENRATDLRCNDTFASFIVDELMPWVRERYHISKNPSGAIIGGLSLGGLTATYLGLKYSEIFGNVLSQSGSYWYKPEGTLLENKNCWMSTQFEKIDKLPLKFYLNVGVIETKDRMIDTNINLREVLLSKGYNVTFEEFKSGHDSLCWGETLATGLMALI